jgi:hypothetical protein
MQIIDEECAGCTKSREGNFVEAPGIEESADVQRINMQSP